MGVLGWRQGEGGEERMSEPRPHKEVGVGQMTRLGQNEPGDSKGTRKCPGVAESWMVRKTENCVRLFTGG